MKAVLRILGLSVAIGWLADAQASSWHQLPVSGALVRDLVVLEDGLLYAGTNNGVYRSSDRGNTWSPTQSPAPARTFLRLHVVDQDPQKLVALTLDEARRGGSALEVSLDGGATWQITHVDYRFVGSGTLATHPSLPGVVLFASAGITLRSQDGGLTWSELGPGMSKKNIFAIRDQPGRFVATSYNYGKLLESNDGGLSWTSIDLQPILPVGDYLSFEQDLSQPSTLYFASYRLGGQAAASGRIDTRTGSVSFFADVCGCSHVRVVADPHRSGRLVAPSVAFDPQTSVVLGRPFRESLDGGATWHELGRLARKIDEDYRWYFDPWQRSTVYLPTAGAGIHRSDDDGLTFSPRYSGMNAGVVTNLLVNPANPQDFLVVRQLLPMLHTGDGGASFSLVAADFHSDLPVAYEDRSRITRAWTEPNVLVGFDNGSFYRSQDGGRSWGTLSSDFPFSNVWTRAIQFAGTGSDKLVALAEHQEAKRIYRSADGGQHWTSTGLGDQAFVNRIGSGSDDAAPVYARTESYYSLRGSLWRGDRFDSTFRHVPMPDSDSSLSWILSAPDPADTWRILAISEDSSTTPRPRQVWETRDAGATWHTLGTTDLMISIAYGGVPIIDACDGRTIWEGLTGQVSRDSGRSFRRTDTGIPFYLMNFQAVCHDQQSHAFAITSGGIAIREPEASDTLLKTGHDP